LGSIKYGQKVYHLGCFQGHLRRPRNLPPLVVQEGEVDGNYIVHSLETTPQGLDINILDPLWGITKALLQR